MLVESGREAGERFSIMSFRGDSAKRPGLSNQLSDSCVLFERARDFTLGFRLVVWPGSLAGLGPTIDTLSSVYRVGHRLNFVQCTPVKRTTLAGGQAS